MVYYLHRLQQNTLIILYHQPLNMNSTEQLLKKNFYFQLTVCVSQYVGMGVVGWVQEKEEKKDAWFRKWHY